MATLIERACVEHFLREHPRLALRPCRAGLLIKGVHDFHVKHGDIEIEDSFGLSISIPESFPRGAPAVTETSWRIPRLPGFHINPDGTLCVGSPLRILVNLSSDPTIEGYVRDCLNPYLAAVSYKLRHGGDLLFGELPHGAAGELEDYARLLGLRNPMQVRAAITSLGERRRVANKRRCPCDCGRRLGRCALHRRLLPLRKMAPRRWYKERAASLV